MDQAKRIADEAKVRADIVKEGIVEKPGNKYERGPDGVLRKLQVAGTDPNAQPTADLTEAQGKALLYHGWGTIAQDQLQGKEDVLAKGFAQEAAGKVPFAGNALLSKQYRQAKAASEAFTTAWLRSTSGANFGPGEQQNHLNMLVPRFGDDPQVMKNKAALREVFLRSQYGLLPDDGREAADYNIRKYREQQAADRSKAEEEMKGAEKVVGKVYVNPRTKGRRVWTGSAWEDL
jgi:hypothetical protein